MKIPRKSLSQVLLLLNIFFQGAFLALRHWLGTPAATHTPYKANKLLLNPKIYEKLNPMKACSVTVLSRNKQKNVFNKTVYLNVQPTCCILIKNVCHQMQWTHWFWWWKQEISSRWLSLIWIKLRCFLFFNVGGVVSLQTGPRNGWKVTKVLYFKVTIVCLLSYSLPLSNRPNGLV